MAKKRKQEEPPKEAEDTEEDKPQQPKGKKAKTFTEEMNIVPTTPSSFGTLQVEAIMPALAQEADSSFAALDVSEMTKKAVAEMGFTHMTEIQR